MNIQKYNIIFTGTPKFAVPSLQALIKDERFWTSTVVTAPDVKIGRKQILTPPSVKVVAEKHGITILQPEKITSITDKISNLNPDLIVVVAYGQIIPESILTIPKFGCLNLHASLLPKYRGASPIQSAILNGDKKTGVTLMKMDTGLDTGPIIAHETVEIADKETGETLHDKLAKLSAEVLIKYLPQYLDGLLKPRPQDDSQATSTPKLTRENGKIDWNKSALEIERMVRAYYPWPGSWTTWSSKILKVIAVSSALIKTNEHAPGTVFLHDGQLAVQCKKDALIIEKLQLEGKREMSAKEFLAGHKDVVGKALK